MESRCGFCFHPLGAAAAAACNVCGKAPTTTTSPFGFSYTNPSRGFSFTPRQSSEPAHATGVFGQAAPPATASPSASGFSMPVTLFPQPAPINPFVFPPVSPANASAFGCFSTPGTVFRQPAPPAMAFPPMSSANASSQSLGSKTESCMFDDDEPVQEPPAATLGGVQEASSSSRSNNRPLVLKTHCELPAIARGCSRDSFAVLVHAKAPGVAAPDHTGQRASLDLITVLDVSGSMAEDGKLELLKEAMGFVIDKLGPADRLSIVSFSNVARRITPLTRMSDAGRASAKLAVRSLFADGGTNILKGLDTAAKVLDGCRYRNAVASVILLSDGQDTCNLSRWVGADMSYHCLVPRSLVGSSDGSRPTPIHTFGFGTYHDSKAMHAVAETTGGTYSFIENKAVVQDAFAQCIGGLLSVAVQGAWISVACPHPDVRIRAVKSGRYQSRVIAYGRAASVDVGELYADEERRFLLFVDVPTVADDEDGDQVTCLIRVSCTYKDTATGKSTEVAGEDAVVRRPAEVTSQEDKEPSMEVQVERFRVEAAEDIAAARAAAERGDHAEAARILDRRREAAGTGYLVGDARCAAVVFELAELSARVATRQEYEQTGRSSMLSGMISHAQQRAASVNFVSCMASAPPAFGGCAPNIFGSAAPTLFGAAFATPAMKDMVDSSRKIREERGQSSAPSWATTTMPSSGSIFDGSSPNPS